jgi:hypothetical protein
LQYEAQRSRNVQPRILGCAALFFCNVIIVQLTIDSSSLALTCACGTTNLLTVVTTPAQFTCETSKPFVPGPEKGRGLKWTNRFTHHNTCRGLTYKDARRIDVRSHFITCSQVHTTHTHGRMTSMLHSRTQAKEKSDCFKKHPIASRNIQLPPSRHPLSEC